MGIGGISIWQLLIILLIVMMLFGTKRLRGLGSDLGAAIKGFRSSVSNEDESGKDESGKGENGSGESDENEALKPDGGGPDAVHLKKEPDSKTP